MNGQQYVSFTHAEEDWKGTVFRDYNTVCAAIKAIDTEKEWSFHSELIVILKVPYYISVFRIINSLILLVN